MLHVYIGMCVYVCVCLVTYTEKGDALHAAEIALSLEKLNFGKLRELHSLGEEADDADLTHCECLDTHTQTDTHVTRGARSHTSPTVP